MQRIKLEYFKILSLRTKPHQREDVDSQLSSLRASRSPAFSYSFRIAAGSKCQDLTHCVKVFLMLSLPTLPD